MHDDGISPISLMVHSVKSSQPMYRSDLDSKVGLLEACTRFDFGYIMSMGLGHMGSKVGLG
jgi:hypothetical protein